MSTRTAPSLVRERAAAAQVSHEHDHSLHRIRSESVSFAWDNSIPPALEIESGETVELETADASGGPLTADSTPADVAALDFDRVNPVTGPVFVRGAQPGDVLAVEILELRPHACDHPRLRPACRRVQRAV